MKHLLVSTTALFLAACIFSNAAFAEESPRERETRALTEITITADPFNPSLLDYGSPVSVLKKDEVVKKGQTTIGETIANEPGVSSSYFGPGASRPVIRGNAGERVRVLKNGVGSLDVSNTSEDHAVSTNPLAAESIEILRGPETLLYGNSAIGGVVNVTDNSIPEKNIGKDLTGAVDFRQGTADDELTGAVKLEGQSGKFNWHLDYFHQRTNEIEIPGLSESKQLRAQEEAEGEGHEEDISDGKLEDSATRSEGITAGGSYIWEKGFIGISANYWESRYGVPAHSHHHHEEHGHHEDEEDHHDEDEAGHHDEDEDEHHGEEEEHHDDEDEDHHDEEGGVAIDAEQLRVDIRGEVNEPSKSIENIKFKVGLSTYEHDEIEGGSVGSTFENDAVEARVELAHAPIGSFEGVLGFQIQASDFSPAGAEAFLPQTDTFSPAVFLFEEVELNQNWKLQAGTRYEFVSYDAQGFSSDEFHPFGISTGVVWDPTGQNDYTVGLSLAFTERAPSFTELYADGAHIARSIFEMGSTELKKEKSYGADLTFKKNTGVVTGALNLFVQDYDDYINLSGSGLEEDELPIFNYESIEALLWGFEAESTIHLCEVCGLFEHDLDFHTQIDYTRGKNRSDSDDLPRIPPLRTIVGLEYKYKNSFSADVEGIFVKEQDDVAEFELPTDDYEILNSSLNYKLAERDGKQITLYVRGTNLTDEEVRVHSSFIKDLAPLRGRSVLFGLRGTF